MSTILPSQLLEYDLGETIAVDTETSGKHPDDGAAVSVVSVSWVAYEPIWAELAAKGLITLEYETISQEPFMEVPIASVAWPFDQGVLPGKPEYTGQEMLWQDVENLPASEWRVLMDDLLPGYRHVYHNALFDLAMLREGTRLWPGRDLFDQFFMDTFAAVDMAWRATGTAALKETCARLFPWRPVKDEAEAVKKYLAKNKLPKGRYDLVSWDVLGPYADLDARLTLMLYYRIGVEMEAGTLAPWMDKDKAKEVLRRRIQTTKVCYRMERKGLPYDEVRSRDTAGLVIDLAKKTAKALPFRPTPTAAKEYFFSPKGLDLIPHQVTATGAPSLTEEVVERMADEGVPYAADWQRFNKLENAASMWYTGYADKVGADGRLRARFRVFGTRSGRFSVERVNLQAIPQDYRLKMLADEGIPTPRDLIKSATPVGWRIWELDLAQAELRYGAYLAKCKLMLDMIENGDDLHGYTTRNLFNVEPDDPSWGENRQVGKRGNFSIMFGCGVNTFRSMISKETGLIMDEGEVRRIIHGWNRLFPEFAIAIEHHMRVVINRQRKHGNGWIDLLNGERRWFQRYEDAHKAFNQRVQGNLAQYAINWMAESDAFLQEQGLDEHQAGLLLTVHDSQVLLLPDSVEGEQMAAHCANIGRRLWTETFPGLPGDVDYKGK